MHDSEGKRIVELPEVTHHVFKVKLDPDIRELYDTAFSAVQQRVKDMIAANEHMQNYVRLLDILRITFNIIACSRIS